MTIHNTVLTRMLTPYQTRILIALGRGLCTKDIAAELGIAPCTVDTRIKDLKYKFGGATRLRLAVIGYAIQQVGAS